VPGEQIQAEQDYIPCSFIRFQEATGSFLHKQSLNQKTALKVPRKKVIIYFHGNAEDIGHSYDFCKDLSSQF
jgi:hypothetical protein